MDPLLGRMAAWYQRSVGTELRKYGLRYEDLLDPQLDLVSHRFLPVAFGLLSPMAAGTSCFGMASGISLFRRRQSSLTLSANANVRMQSKMGNAMRRSGEENIGPRLARQNNKIA